MKVSKHVLIESILLFLLVGLSIYSIRQCTTQKDIPVIPEVKTDTIYRYSPFIPQKELKYVSVPRYVILYPPNDTVFIENIITTPGNIEVVYRDSSSANFNPQFLSRYPEAHKLVQMTTNRGQLELTTLSTRGILQTTSYNFNPELYNYNYYGNALTYKRKPFYQNLNPTVELMVRPINSMYDINIGIEYKTRNIQYELGINGHYYPATKLGYGPYLKVKYTFDIWRKR